jgi:hypothetical protein
MALSLAGCEKALMEENPANTPQANFDLLWQTFNDKYTYFDLKNLNWDSVYQVYSPLVSPNMSEAELFTVLDSMLFLLEDGHVNLVSDFNISRNWEWYLNYPENFNYPVIERNYLGQDYQIAGGLYYTILNDTIGYIYYPSFSSSINTAKLNAVFNYLANTKALIFDIRNNGGGSLNNAYALAARLAPQEQSVLLRRYKTGPRPSDFSETFSVSLSPSSEINYAKPVALLTNRKSYSAANTFAAILSSYPQVLQIGDRTGGGGGLPADQELPNGWRFRFSATRETTPMGAELELGIAPAIALDLDSMLLRQGKDGLIERALLELN